MKKTAKNQPLLSEQEVNMILREDKLVTEEAQSNDQIQNYKNEKQKLREAENNNLAEALELMKRRTNHAIIIAFNAKEGSMNAKIPSRLAA